MTGTVKWFDEDKGFGFIRVQGEQDVFVHHTSIADSGIKTGSGRKILTQGDQVEFAKGVDPRNNRIRAEGVRVVAGRK